MARRTLRQLINIYSDGSIEVHTKGAGARFNPVTGGSGRLKSPTARRSVSLKKNPARRIGYCAKYGRKSADFFAQNDKAAETYANGLLAHKMGRAPSSLKRNGKRPPKT